MVEDAADPAAIVLIDALRQKGNREMRDLHRMSGRLARRTGLITLAGAFAAFGPGAAAMAANLDGDSGQTAAILRRSDGDDDGLLVLDDLDDLDSDDLATLDLESATGLDVQTAQTLDGDTATLGADTADTLEGVDQTVTLEAAGAALAADTLDTLTGDSLTALSADSVSALTSIDTMVESGADVVDVDGDTASADGTAGGPSADSADSVDSAQSADTGDDTQDDDTGTSD